MAHYFATCRLLTGTDLIRGYVYDRQTGKVVVACTHKHRRAVYAQRCAERALIRFLRTR